MTISELVSAFIRSNALFPASRRRGWGRRPGRVPSDAALAADRLETRIMLAAVSWDGEAGDFQWNNSLNWSGNSVPGSADDVTISGAVGTFKVQLSGNASVRSLQSAASLQMNGGSLTVTAPSLVEGTFSMYSSATLTAQGATSTFLATGATTLQNASLIAAAGASLSLPQFTSYDGGTASGSSTWNWRATGAGSILDLPALMTITGSVNHNTFLNIESLAGGVVDLPAVTQILVPAGLNNLSRGVRVLADGVDSVVNLPTLTTWNDQGNSSGSGITIRNSGAVNFDNLTSATGVSLYVSDGLTLTLPALTTFAANRGVFSGHTWNWRATGPGSTLDLPALTTITGSQDHNTFLNIESLAGGVVDLPAVTQILVPVGSNNLARGVRVLSDGMGSIVNLPSLTNWNDLGNTSGSSITIRNSGAVNFDNLTSATGVSLYVTDGLTLTLPALTTFAANRGVFSGHTWNWRATGPGSTLDLPALTTITGSQDHNTFLNIESLAGGVVDLPAVTQILVPVGSNNLARGVRVLADGVGSVVNLPALTNWNDQGNTSGSSITIRNSGAVNFDNLTSATGVSLYVSDALTLTLPALTTFAINRGVFGGHTWNWRATGLGSTLDLPALRTIAGPLDNRVFLNIESLAGGEVNLPLVTEIIVPNGFNNEARGVRVLADGIDSLVNAPALTNWNDQGNTSGSSITIRNSGAVNFDNLASAIGVSLYVSDALTLTLPALTTFAINRGVFGGHTWNWRATGPGSTLDLPALRTIAGPLDNSVFLNIESLAGGEVNLPVVTEIIVPSGFNNLSRGVRVLADGINSLINLSGLTSIIDMRLNPGSKLETRTGGRITLNPADTTATRVSVVVGANSEIAAGTLTIASGSTLSGSGTFAGNLINDGDVYPGANVGIGSLSIDGSYTQTDAGRLNLEIGGLVAGTGHDQLNVSGRATLAGTLTVFLVQNFAPAFDDHFEIVNFGSRVCDFEFKQGLELGNNLYLAARFTSQTMKLVAGDEPDPGQQCQAIPEFTDIAVGPNPAKAGDNVSITFSVNGPLAEDPSVTVNGRDAAFVSRLGLLYTYVYAVTGDESEGAAEIVILGQNLEGQEGTATRSTVFDFTTPTISSLVSDPVFTQKGDQVTVTFFADEPLNGSTVVTVGGRPANLISVDGLQYTYRRLMTGQEGTGFVSVEVIALDLAGNSGNASTQIEVGGGLSVDSSTIVFSNANPDVGEQVTASVVVRNTDGRATENVEIQFTLYEPGGGIRALGSSTVPTIAAHGEVVVPVTFDVQSPGVQLFEVRVDPDGLINEDTEADNTASRALPVGDVQAMIQINAQLSATNVVPGGLLTVTGNAWYPGFLLPVKGSSVSSSVVGFSGEALTTTDSHGDFTVALVAPETPGSHLVRVQVSDGTIEGTIYLNLTVLAPASGVDLSTHTGHITTASAPIAGQANTITARVNNTGADNFQGSFDVNFYEGAILLGTVTVTDLAAGAHRMVSIPHTFASSGDREIRVVVDPANRIEETSEANNVAVRAFRVLEPIADLTPTNIVLSTMTPSTIQAVTITAIVRNQGGAATSDVLVHFLDNGAVIGTAIIPGLAAGGATASVSIQTVFATAGAHLVEVVVDPGNLIAETEEDNNQRSATILAHIPAPDLAPSAVTILSGTAVVGETVTASVTIRNQGERSADAFDVRFEQDGVVIDAQRITGLEVNEIRVLEVPIIFATAGSHALRVVVDSNTEVQELSETNNTSTLTLTVFDSLRPDLRVSAGEISMSPAAPSPGETVVVSIPVRNVGIGPADATIVRLMVNGQTLESQPFQLLAAGATRVATFSFVAPSAEGYHLIELIADPGNDVGETDENNNRAFRLLLVGRQPDLDVTGITFSNSSPVEGEVILVSATIRNIGDQNAYGTLVSFYDGSDLIGHVSGVDFVLGESASRTVSVPFSTIGRTGQRTITVAVDPADVIPESNEANNSRTSLLSVSHPANLAPVVVQPIDSVVVMEDAPPTVLSLAGVFDDGDILPRGDQLTLTVSGNSNSSLVTATLAGTFLTLSFAPDGSGTASITVRATDLALDYAEHTFTVSVLAVNDAPVALAGDDRSVNEGGNVGFDGSNSWDVDHDSLIYSWNFGDGNTGSGATPTHSYADNGTYMVTLTISDGTLSATDTLQVTVLNSNPVALFSGPSPIVYGSNVTVSFSEMFDPSSADLSAGLKFAYVLDPDDFSGISYSVDSTTQASWTIAALPAGIHSVYARVIDKDNGFTQYQTQVSVTQAALTVTVADSSRLYGAANPEFSVQYSGFVLEQDPSVLTGSLQFTTAATNASNVGQYAVSASGLNSENYAVTFVDGTLSILKASQTIDWTSPASILYGTALSELQLNAAVSVSGFTSAGALHYETPAGTVLEIGRYELTVTAAETLNYHAASATVMLDVLKAYSFSGFVYIDLNNDGELDLGESGIEGATITLTGEDDLGAAVLFTTTTDDDGFYQFGGLRPGLYRITQSQPTGFAQGTNKTGTLGNVSVGSLSLDTIDQFFIDLSGEVIDPSTDTDAINFNFGEIPVLTGGIQAGETAGIGFWHNKNGQNLIKSLNGGSTSTALGNWLSSMFPNMYGTLSGKTNAQVASHFLNLFALNGKSAPSGPPKLDAQVLATALAVYVTNHSLAGDAAVAYGFRVTALGVGAATITVGTSGAAFGIADHSTVSVLDLLFATNAMAVNGILYSHADATLMQSLRFMANEVYSLINKNE